MKSKSHDSNPDIGLIQITLLAKHFRKTTDKQTLIKLIELNVAEETPTIYKVVREVIL